jgi:predicted phosphodiesterase
MVERVCPLLAGVDAIAHLGDGMGDAGRVGALTGLPVYAVSGNCDLLPEYPAERVEVFVGVRTLLTHGNLLRVKHSPLRLSLRALERGSTDAVRPHHVPAAEWVRGVLLVNPGALMTGATPSLSSGTAVPPRSSERLTGNPHPSGPV